MAESESGNVVSFDATIVARTFSKDAHWYRLDLETDRKNWSGGFSPGQFATLRIPDGNTKHRTVPTGYDFPEAFLAAKTVKQPKRQPFLRRPFSIYETGATPDGKTRISFLIACLGVGSTILSRLPEGETIEVLAPLGKGFPVHEGVGEVLLVGGGVGIAPLIGLAREYRARGVITRLFFGIRSRDSVLTADGEYLFDTSCAHSFRLSTEISEEGFHQGFVTTLFEEDVLKHPRFLAEAGVVASCGPTPMFASLAGLLHRYKVKGDFSLENFMACGMGSCMGCVVPLADPAAEGGKRMARTCVEGPVFPFEKVFPAT